MAKTQGGLFSLGASGTVAKLLTFNQSHIRQVARRMPRTTTPPTTPQAYYRKQCTDAAAVWRSLPPLEKVEWKTVAGLSAKNVFAKYLLEWMAQASTPTTPPQIPMR